MELKRYETDETLAQKGVWIEIDGAEFLIASNNNPNHKRKLNRERKKRNAHRLSKDLDAMTDLAIEAAIGTILLDWRGVTNQGEPFPYSEENARKLLAIDDLRTEIFSEAQDAENFQQERMAADAADLKSSA